MNIDLRWLTLIALTLLTMGSGEWRAEAQYTNAFTGRTFNNPMSSYMDTLILHGQQRRMLLDSFKLRGQQGSRKSGSSGSSAKTPAKPRTAPHQNTPNEKMTAAATAFKPSARPVMLQDLSNQLGRTAQERQQLARFFTQSMAAYEQEARKAKHPHDLALGLAFFIATNYTVCQPDHEPTSLQIERLWRTLRVVLASLPQMRAAGDRRKQGLYEALVSFAVFTMAGYKQGTDQKDKAIQDIFQKLATQNLQTVLGVPADKMSFTEAGLVIQ